MSRDMLVVNKDDKYGVVSTKDFSVIIGTKYDKMVYLENTEEFIVTNDGKTGVLSKDGEVKIGLRYDEVGLIDGEEKIFYVKNDNLYGVLNQNGKVLVQIEYDGIGIDRKTFPLYNFYNNLLLYNNCIPLKKSNKWGIVDKSGNTILNFEYDKLGYAEIAIVDDEQGENNLSSKTGNRITNSVNGVIDTTTGLERSINNAAVIPDIKGIIIGKNGKYGVVNSIGKMVIPCEFDKIYSITNEGNDEYYLEKNNRTTKLTKYLEDNKINVEEIGPSQTNNVINNTVNNIVTENKNTVTNSNTNSLTNTNKNTTTNTTTNTNSNVVTNKNSNDTIIFM